METDFSQIDQLVAEGWESRLNNITRGKNLSEQALQLAETASYTLGIMRSKRNLAAIHNAMHDYEQGLTYVHQAFMLLNEEETPSDAFDIYLLAAAVYVRLGNIPKAISYCYKAEDLPIIEGNPARKAELYKTVGNAYLTVQEYETAVSYYHQARAMYQSIGDIEGEIIILNNLCHCLHHSGKFDEALQYGHLGLDLYKTQNNKISIKRVYGYNLNNVGTTYNKAGRYNEAPPYFEEALNVFKQDEDVYGEVYSWRGLGAISLHNKDYDEAISRFKQSLSLAQKSGVTTELILTNRTLARAYKEMAQYENALIYFEKFYDLEKSIINDDIEKRIRNLEATHRVQQAQKESEIYQLKSVELQKEIDERKKAEDQLQTYAQELERSNKDLENFASIVSHDLQTPLRKIMVYSDRLQDSYANNLDERGLNYLTRMQAAATRMQQLINDLLTLSHVSTQKQTFTPVPLKEIAQDVLIDFELVINEKEANIKIDDLPQIEADATQIRQLFQNLIGNALKFHQPNLPPVIEIEGKVIKKKKQEWCRLQIRDHGIGIDEKYRERIFKLFERLPTETETKGSGVGLAICQRIVERHNGTIQIESKLNQGTTFIVTLPLKQS